MAVTYPFHCWTCAFFNFTDAETTKEGQCRQRSPQMMAAVVVPSLPTEIIWAEANIDDGTVHWCGEYKKASRPDVPLP